MISCISLYSYIKPQLPGSRSVRSWCCISLYSYIKPQRLFKSEKNRRVVYLYIPTSNHNLFLLQTKKMQLYIFIFLHQTTTDEEDDVWTQELYIFIFLHQTTTVRPSLCYPICCISLYSYIKPQRVRSSSAHLLVVYLYIPTSNHNHDVFVNFAKQLYIFIFLHQTTTGGD